MTTEEETKKTGRLKTNGKNELANKLGAIGWGLFFIWIGIILLFKISASVCLLGIGIITLGIQVGRKYFNLKLERFWIIVGALFLAGGLWEVLKTKLPLMPVLLIIAGLAIIVLSIKGKYLIKK